MNQRTLLVASLVMLALLVSAMQVAGQGHGQQSPHSPSGTTFTYQGQLQDANGPVNATCHLQFSLWDALEGGSQVGTAPPLENILLVDGLFTVQLDFGPAAFQGDARWLQVSVSCPAGSSYFTLTPRQELTASPYALSAPWSGLSGLPPGFADAVDDDTTYSPGFGLYLLDHEFSVDTTTIQARVGGSCPQESAIRAIGADGTVTCQSVVGGTGNITAVRAGTGLSGGGESGELTLDLAATYQLPQLCAAGQIAAWDGAGWICVADSDSGGDVTAVTAGTGLLGGGISGTVVISADTDYLQRRVDGTCDPGTALRVVSADGTVTCEPVGSAPHDHWGESWSGGATGLTLSGGDMGLSGSGSNTGLYGAATATSGEAIGVQGLSNSTEGSGVFGKASAASGGASGVAGESASSDGRGVYGYASASNGMTFGIRGVSDSTAGRGVFGLANAGSGQTYGVRGVSISTEGSGVYGWAYASSGDTYGVYGQADSPHGHGVHGYAPSTEGGNVGVYGESAASYGEGVVGVATATSGWATGVVGRSFSTDGYGVMGSTTSSSGPTSGVYGNSGSTEGTGVTGLATADTGTTYGVDGRSWSTSGRGVFGRATATSGATHGVRGISDSTDGRGVSGLVTATSGPTYGLYGQSDSSEGRGVNGWATAASGVTYGVRGRSDSTQGRGVFGYVTASNGENYGVRGVSDSVHGYGVYGWATASSAGSTYGVAGRSDSRDGRGVSGHATATDGLTIGVHGQSDSPWGYGVYGRASAGSGWAHGVYGSSSADEGAGVTGYATAQSGVVYGVRGQTNSPDGYGGYFVGRLGAEAEISAYHTPDNHVALLHNTSTGASPDVLALKVGTTVDPDTTVNYVTFFKGDDTAVGAIEGTGSGGVTLKSGSGDYAEFLPRLDPQERIEPGDLVGIFGGRVTRATRGADQVLVASSGPIVLGNDPGEDEAALYEEIAFLGQVQVRVRGPVAAGDLIMPSGFEDGTGVAVSSKQITPEQFAQAVGQAWESSADKGVKDVLIAVGLLHHDPTVAQLAGQVDDLEARLTALEAQQGTGTSSTRPPAAWLLLGGGMVAAGVMAGRRTWGGGR